MAKKTLSEVLAAAAPKPVPRAVVEAEVRAQVDDLDRILSLPRRPPLDLSFDPVTKRHKPDVQALIEVMTARLGRGRRISCGCRPRVIQARDGGTLVITRVLPEEVIEKFGPEAPVVTTVKAFVADNQANDDEIAIAERVSRLKSGEKLDVEACDGGEGHFCFDTLNAFQAWALYEIPREGGGIGFSAVGSGKCLAGDTEVYDTKNGKRRLVKELGDFKVASYDGKDVLSNSATAFESGEKECCRLVLRDGSAIELSLDHRVYTHRGWVEAGDLTPTDMVAVPVSLPEPENPTVVSDDEVACLAFMMADGGFTNEMLYFTDENPSVIAEFLRLAPMFCEGAVEDKTKSKARTFHLKGTGVRGDGFKFRNRWNLFDLSKNKRVTPEVWGLPTRQIALFMNRFWACDGHISLKELECTLASEKLIDDIRFLLLRLGIRSRKKFKLAKIGKKEYDAWRIMITGNDALRFLHVVGDVIGSEERCEKLRNRLESIKRNPNTDVVPVGRKELYEICDEYGVPSTGGRGRPGQRFRTTLIRDYFKATEGQFVSRGKFIDFCEKWQYKGKYVHLGSRSVAWERVESVTEIGRRPVYDLSVPATENFVANNMVVHNSGFFLLFPIALGDECETAALLIEPNQRVHYRSQYVRIREHFRVPSLIPEDGGRTYMVPGAPPLHLVAYSKLGNPKHPEGLDILNPNVVLPDEAHRLTGKSQSTTRKRVKRLIAKRIKEREEMMARGLPVRRRAVYFVPMSGTLEDKSIEDTQPVSAFALGTNSPLPLDEAEAAAWSLCIDPIKSGNDTKSKTAKRLQRAFTGKVFQAVEIEDLLDDEGPTNEIRKGFCARRMETPGVITASATDVTTSISFKKRDAPAMPEIVKEALRMVREEGLRPDGEPIVGDEDESMAAMIKAVARQVASGHFNFWAYPKIPCTCAGREPRCEGCKKIDWWFECRKRYFAESRKILLESLPHLDSPKLCKNAAIRAQEDTSHPTGVDIYCVKCREPWPCYKLEADHLPAWRANTFKEWHEIEDKVPHEKRVRWIGDKTPEAEDPATHPGYFLARDTTKWAQENNGVIWVQTIAYGEKVAQLSKVPYYGGGPNNETMIRAENGKRSIILALRAWGKGLDSLQLKFWKQLFPEFFSGNRVGEQVLGRLARRGQRKDTVLSEYYAHVQEIRDAIRTVRRLAEFNQAMSGNKALILAADWDDE